MAEVVIEGLLEEEVLVTEVATLVVVEDLEVEVEAAAEEDLIAIAQAEVAEEVEEDGRKLLFKIYNAYIVVCIICTKDQTLYILFLLMYMYMRKYVDVKIYYVIRRMNDHLIK